MPEPPLRAFFGHHKCATTWINSIAQPVCQRLGLKFVNVDNTRAFDNDLAQFVAGQQAGFLSYTNAAIQHTRRLGQARAFHVIRDPRDLIVSAYFSHRNSHPTTGWAELAAHRERLQSVAKDEGLFIEMAFSAWELDDLNRWDYAQPTVLELKMEDLIARPYERLLEAFQFLGLAGADLRFTGSQALAVLADRAQARSRGLLPFKIRPRQVPALELFGIVYENRFEAKTRGRRAGDEDPHSHYRKGVAGDWVNHFNADHRRRFKERYNDLLLKLGYETSPDW